jgi:predicted small secreted protein
MKYVMIMVLALSVSACGNTITGVGKDISDVGAKMTDWQNKKSEEKSE